MKFNNDLVIKAQSGDIWAYENIVNEFSAMAKGYAYSILKDYHYAEDVAQESFALAFFKLKMLKSPEAFPSWFRKIVFSQCEHFYRKKRLPVVPFDVFYDTESLEQSPLDIVERNELRTRIIKAIKSLPEKERTVTILFYFQSYSMTEISNFLDVPIGTIKNRLFSARKKLQKEMIDITGYVFKAHGMDSKFTERVKNMIASGYKNTLIVKSDGKVMAWGNLSRYNDPRTANDKAGCSVIAGLKDVKSIAASSGCYGAYALLNDGTVWAWGWNIFQHLGTGSKEEYIITPERVKSLENVISIAAGVSHALALTTDGTVWAWGKNWYGQLGSGLDTKDGNSFPPTKVANLQRIKQISAGYFHSLALAEDGTVWRWGGYGNSEFLFPIAYAVNTPVKIENPGKITAISSGGMHDVMLCEGGTVWACGYNTFRQLGSNTVFNEILDAPVRVGNLERVKMISAGGHFTLALKEDGTVWAWGRNEDGELGVGTYDAKTEISLGDNKNEPVEVAMLQDVVEIAAGCFHAMAVTKDGSIWAWGGNDEGQLGNFTVGKRCVPQRLNDGIITVSPSTSN